MIEHASIVTERTAGGRFR
jgi:predicted SAM-dependent methyltransferase